MDFVGKYCKGIDVQILIVKTGLPGELLDALPAVHLLKTGLSAEINWVVNGDNAKLVKCFDDVNRVISFPSGTFLADLRKDKYDLVVDMDGGLKSALIARAARSHKRIGPSFHREFAYLFYDHVAAERNHERPIMEQNLDVLRFLELPTAPVEFPVTFPASVASDAAIPAAKEILRKSGR